MLLPRSCTFSTGLSEPLTVARCPVPIHDKSPTHAPRQDLCRCESYRAAVSHKNRSLLTKYRCSNRRLRTLVRGPTFFFTTIVIIDGLSCLDNLINILFSGSILIMQCHQTRIRLVTFQNKQVNKIKKQEQETKT